MVSTLLIERHLQYPKEVVRAVRKHHECMDGSGYPRHLVADAISPLGKLLSLATMVAAMFAPDRNAPDLRLSVLLRMNTHRYNNTLALQIIGLLQSQTDSTPIKLEPLPDPVQLLHIDDALAQIGGHCRHGWTEPIRSAPKSAGLKPWTMRVQKRPDRGALIIKA